MNELKNCPFCNCEMEVETVGRDWWRIQPIDGHDDLCPMRDVEYNCTQSYPVDEHIKDWNMRADGWVSIDTLPDNKYDGNEFIILTNGEVTNGDYSAFSREDDGWGDYCLGGCFYVPNSDSDYGGMFRDSDVTHWMPLPLPPAK